MTSEAGDLMDRASLKSGEIAHPIMTRKTAARIVEDFYGMKVLNVTELNSYYDKNHKIDVSNEDISNSNIKDIWPHGYVLKVLNSVDSKRKHIDAEHEIQRLLHKAGVSCCQPVFDKQGRGYSLQKIYHEYEENEEEEKGEEGQEAGQLSNRGNSTDDQPFGMHLVQLLTFIPGQIIASVPHTPELLLEAGQLFSKIDTVLQGYSHPALKGYQTSWNLKQIPRVREFLHAVEEPSKKDLCISILKAFDNVVLPLENDFKEGVIHADFNDQNVLARKLGRTYAGSDEYCISGVIDFAEVTESYYFFEIAIAICHNSLNFSSIDTLDIGGYLLAGYLPQIPLNSSEWKVLKECVCARICSIVLIGVYTHRMDPSNTHALFTPNKAWGPLKRIWETPKRDLYLRWQRVIKELDPSIQLPDIEDII